MKENRKHKRLKIDLMIMCEIDPGESYENQMVPPFSPLIVNLSQGGVCIATDHILPIHRTINIIFQAVSTYEYVELKGEIAWSYANSDELFHSGIKFLDLDAEKLDLINLCLKEFDFVSS